MNIVIGTNIYALDDLKQKAEKFCKQNGIDKEAMIKDFSEAYESFHGNKFLLFINVLQGVSTQLSDVANTGVISPIVAEVMNNLYLAAAMIETVDEEAQLRNILDGTDD